MTQGKLKAAFLIALAASAIAASSAHAAATTSRAEWYTGASPGTTLTVGTAVGLNAAVGTDPNVGAKFVLVSEVGSPPQGIILTATGLSCASCTIENEEVTGKVGAIAFSSEKLQFSGVTSALLGCSVASETGTVGAIVTKALTVHSDFMNGTTAVEQFLPSATTFASFELFGKSCPVSGLYAIKGTLFADFVNATGVFAKSQEVRFSPAIQTADGGGLTIGVKEARLTGTGVFSLANGAEFAVK